MTPDDQTVALYETASAWFTERRAGHAWSGKKELELQAWLEADPRHRQAYDEIAQTWDAFDHVARPVLARDHATRPGPALAQGRRTGWTWFGNARHTIATAALAFSLLCAGGWYWHDNTVQFSQSIHTAQAGQREVTLPDGSALTLNQNTHLEVAFYPRRREVVLLQGEAFFEVATRHGDPFQVTSGDTRIHVVGTAFNVRTSASALYVKVREGTVKVERRARNGNQVEILNAGDGVEAEGRNDVLKRSSSEPEAAGSWRTGQLVFRNVSLYEVADELRGYLGEPIEVVGRQVRNHRLSGFASTANPQDFLQALPQLLPVSVQHVPGTGYRIGAR